MKAVVVSFSSLLFFSVSAGAAPAQLQNKSVVIGWSESIQERDEAGQVINTSINRERVAYISSAGRVFVRASTTSRYAQKRSDLAPGAAAGTLAFQGNSLVGTSVFAGFARRLTVNFDASFSSCSASVVYGKAGGPQKWKSIDGSRTYEVLSMTVGSVNCSIRDGNLVAN